MKSSIFIILAFGVVACGTVRPVTGVDSTRVEVRTETRFVHDTSWVEIPVIVEKVATLDTASVLENKYAKSEASVSGGILSLPADKTRQGAREGRKKRNRTGFHRVPGPHPDPDRRGRAQIELVAVLQDEDRRNRYHTDNYCNSIFFVQPT